MTTAPGAPGSAGSPVRRTTAHDHKQLAEALGWTLVQVDKAVVLGVLPPYDLTTPRWKAGTVDALAARKDELAAALDDGALLTEAEMIARLGWERGDWRRGRDHGIIPGPDCGGFWTRDAAEGLAARAAELHDQVPPQPLGARRCAELLAELTGLDVTDDDFLELAGQGHVDSVDSYKDWLLFDVAAVRRLGTTEDGTAIVAAVVAARQGWLASSVTTEDAARRLGWDRRELERVAARQGIKPGRFRRWASADIDRLAEDRELADRVRRAQLLGPDQAAEMLEVRRVDFDHAVAARWIVPAGYTESRVSRRRTVSVALYRAGDVEDLLGLPGVDWEAVRAARPGDPSPLREFARLPVSRAALVKGLAADLTERHGTEVTARYDEDRDHWDLSWALNDSGQPSEAAVSEMIRTDRDLAPHARSIGLHARHENPASRGKAAGRWAGSSSSGATTCPGPSATRSAAGPPPMSSPAARARPATSA
jgi:hypothetical protein